MKTFQAPGIIKVGSPTKDHGANIRFETQELSDEDYLQLVKYNGSYGYFLFKPSAFSDIEIPKDDAVDKRHKSQSKRIRNALFVLHSHRGGNEQDFEKFYHETTERFLDQIKEKIDGFPLAE